MRSSRKVLRAVSILFNIAPVAATAIQSRTRETDQGPRWKSAPWTRGRAVRTSRKTRRRFDAGRSEGRGEGLPREAIGELPRRITAPAERELSLGAAITAEAK